MIGCRWAVGGGTGLSASGAGFYSMCPGRFLCSWLISCSYTAGVLGATLRALVGLGVIKVCSLQVYYRYWLLCRFLSAATALLSGLGLCLLAIGC